MCDYSLNNVKSRSAKVGDKLTTRNFGTGTRGFAAPEDATTAVCVLPGTELAFSQEVACTTSGFLGFGARRMASRTAAATCSVVLCRWIVAPRPLMGLGTVTILPVVRPGRRRAHRRA